MVPPASAEITTGIVPEVDAETQRRFDKGHEFEATARPWAPNCMPRSCTQRTREAER
jgi:hypothetical protein